MRITRNVVLGLLFALLTPLIVYAGDYPWWTTRRGDKIWGIGEINDRILLYLGDTHWIDPVPYRTRLILLALVLLGLIVAVANRIRQRIRDRKE